jgi:hypothetical protein
MKILATLLLLMPLAAQAAKLPPFYVGQQQYRFDETDPRCRIDQHCSYERQQPGTDHNYSLNFVEVNDDGNFFDEHQLDAARERVRSAREDGHPVTVFIYIHGWHNNAEERSQKGPKDCADSLYDGDVAKFRNCGLKVLADNPLPAERSKAPRVVGIYLAWHGTDFDWLPFNIVPSYPIRRHFARKVGQIGMARALRSIFAVIQEHRDSYFVIAMGHSFGALVLESADEIVDPNYPEAGILRKLRSGVEPLESRAAVPRLPVDMIFYVNAATSNSISRKTIKDWKDKCALPNAPVGCDQNPLYLAVSSRADILTAIVMPIANIVFFAPLTDQYHIISAANTPWMQTHKIPRRLKTIPNALPKNAFCFAIPLPGAGNDYYEVDPKSGKTRAIFWDMNSDRWIASLEGTLHSIPILRNVFLRHWVISSHGDVWNTGVFNMVRGVIDSEPARAHHEVVRCGQQTTNKQAPMLRH